MAPPPDGHPSSPAAVSALAELGTAPRAFSQREWRRWNKLLFKVGCALLGVRLPDLAKRLDANVSCLKAWADLERDHAVPGWAMERLRRQEPKLAAWIDHGMAALPDAAPPAPADAETAADVGAQFMATAIATLATFRPGGYDLREKRAALPGLLAAYDKLGKLIRVFQGDVAAADARAKGGTA